MKTKNLLALLVIAGIMIFASCKEDDSGPLSAEEAQEALNSADDSFNTIKGEAMDSPGMLAQEAIQELGLPFSPPLKANSNYKTNPIEFSNLITYSELEKGGFQPDYIYFAFTEYTGTWEKVSDVWTKVLTTPTDKIVIKFAYNGGTNNGTLTYSDYAIASIPYSTKIESTYITQLKARIDIIGQSNPVMTWGYTANRTVTGGTTKRVYTYGSLFSITDEFSIDRPLAGVTNIEYLFAVKKNGDVVFSKSFSTVIDGLLVKNAENFSINTTAKVIIMNIVIDYTITIDQSTDTSNPGNFMNVSLRLTNGTKVADVVFVGENHEPYFEFADGTTISIEELLTPELLTELEEFMDAIMRFFAQ